MGGGIDSLTATPHVRDKRIAVKGSNQGSLADISLAIFMVHIANSGMSMPDEIVLLLNDYSDGLALGKRLVQSGELEQFRLEQLPITTVYDFLLKALTHQ